MYLEKVIFYGLYLNFYFNRWFRFLGLVIIILDVYILFFNVEESLK